MSTHLTDIHARNKTLTAMQGRIKTALQQGLSELEVYVDLVYKLKKKLVNRTDFSDMFRKIIIRYNVLDICSSHV